MRERERERGRERHIHRPLSYERERESLTYKIWRVRETHREAVSFDFSIEIHLFYNYRFSFPIPGHTNYSTWPELTCSWQEFGWNHRSHWSVLYWALTNHWVNKEATEGCNPTVNKNCGHMVPPDKPSSAQCLPSNPGPILHTHALYQ